MAYHFENIKLEKGMYGRSSRSFSQALEELDPSEHYRGTPLEGLDAFQRQLKRFDIHVKGAGSDMVEKFFHTSDSAVLFPEFVSRVVRQGMEEESILPAITATVTKFDGMDYRSIASVPSEEDKKLRRVEEGARIPETTVRTQENLVHLYKRGRMLVASYEAIRFQRLDLFSVTLRQIGAYIGRMHLEDAIEVLRNGDGNQNAAQQYTIGTKPITGTKGTLTYDALLEFWSQFDPYTMNTMLVGSDVMLAMLKLDEFQNPLTGLNFQGTGTLTTPLGAKLLRTSAMPAGILIGLDRNYALEQICGSEITVEYDKLIDRSWSGRPSPPSPDLPSCSRRHPRSWWYEWDTGDGPDPGPGTLRGRGGGRGFAGTALSGGGAAVGEAAAAGNDDGGLRQGVPLRRGLHRRRGPGGGAGR